MTLDLTTLIRRVTQDNPTLDDQGVAREIHSIYGVSVRSEFVAAELLRQQLEEIESHLRKVVESYS